MADSRDPPPFEETQENDDLFKSALDTPTKEELTRNGIDELMSGGGEEVSLEEDEDQPQTTGAKLEFQQSPEQEIVTPPAQMSLSQTKEEAPSTNVVNAEEGSLEISVVEPQRVGDGMGAYVVYKVETRTTLPYFSRKSFSVARRFSDFLGLHSRLQAKHLHLGRIVPPPPSKDLLGTTKVKMSKDSESGSSSEFVERRRVSLERYLRRVGAHPVLRTDPDFREFLELGEDLPRARGTQALSSAGVLRLFSRVGDSVAKIAFLRMDEADPWFEEKQHQIENLDQQLRKLHASVESLVMHRKELAGNTGSLGRSIASLGTCEEHTALSRALSQLSEVHDRLEQLHAKQAASDFFQLAELIKDYVTLIAAVKEVFGQRVKVYQTWQHAQQILTKKREQKAKLELAAKQDKLPQAKEEVIEWEAKCERGQEEFENISQMIRKEVERFERSRVHDFKLSIVRYMEALLDTQQQLIKHWESFLPEAKAIA